jgi:hypothetical protein
VLPPQRLQVSSVRISVGRRAVVARAGISRAALARLSLLRGRITRRSVRKQWLPGTNSIRLLIPARARGRWTAVLRVGTQQFRRTIRFG